MRYIRQQNTWLIINVEMLFRRKLRRHRKLGLDIHKSKIKGVFSLLSQTKYPAYYEQALKVLKEFIPIHIGIYPLIYGGRKTYKKFVWI